MRLRLLIAWIAFAVLAFLCIHAPEKQNAGLPIVDVHKAAMPARGFVCVPAITPRIGPVRSREIVT